MEQPIGSNPRQSQGMAPHATIYSFDWTQEALKLCHAATGSGAMPRINVSNHSHGPEFGWHYKCTDYNSNNDCSERTWTWLGKKTDPRDERFGWYGYDGKAELFDKLIYNRRYLSVFRAVGNDRGIDPTKPGWWSKSTVKKTS
jgi:hypothetical protein